MESHLAAINKLGQKFPNILKKKDKKMFFEISKLIP